MDTILLIEDNIELLDNISEILSLANYNVVKAKNGMEGLERMKEHSQQISLILCDIMMPILDGYGVLRAYENKPEMKGVPFIFLTAKSERADVRKGMDLGADDYLMKPFSGDELLSLINTRIRKSRAIKEMNQLEAADFESSFSDPSGFVTHELFKNKIHIKKVMKQDVLFTEGEKSFYLYYMLKGRAKSFRTNEFGKEYITNIYNAGDFLGYNAILDNGIHVDSAVTLESSEIAMLSKNDFIEVLSSNKKVYACFMKKISVLLNESEEKLPKMAYQSARKKVAEALIYVSKKYCKNDQVLSFNISRDDLSAISGISPESVSRNLTDLKNEGLIGVQNGELIILDFKKLINLRN
ncbi:MAG: response regulator [Bacteroidia bacterium]